MHGYHVAGALCAGGGHVFYQAAQANHADRQLQCVDDTHGAHHRSRTAHVELHGAHACRTFDADATAVEGDTFTHQRQGMACVGRMVIEDQ
ncbi:hypothetical protein D3C71_1388010 [compost metagenome]